MQYSVYPDMHQLFYIYYCTDEICTKANLCFVRCYIHSIVWHYGLSFVQV